MDQGQAPPRAISIRGERRLTATPTGGVPGNDDRVGFLLRLAYQRASANLTEAIGASGLTPMQFATLLRLHERGQMAQNELGRSVGMPPANIHTTVRRLAARGLLETKPSPVDRRLTLVELTTSGRTTFQQVLPAAKSANARTLSSLNREEQDVLVGLLRRLASPPPTSSGNRGRPS